MIQFKIISIIFRTKFR